MLTINLHFGVLYKIHGGATTEEATQAKRKECQQQKTGKMNECVSGVH